MGGAARRLVRHGALVAGLFSSVLAASGASAQEWGKFAQLTASDPASQDLFGTSVGISGDYAVIGAPGRAGGGAAYVFVHTGGAWTQIQMLLGKDSGAQFGLSVAIEGDDLIVGAPRRAVGQGKGVVYFYARVGSLFQPVLGSTSFAGGPAHGTLIKMRGGLAAVSSCAAVGCGQAATVERYQLDVATSTWAPAGPLGMLGAAGDVGRLVAVSGSGVAAYFAPSQGPDELILFSAGAGYSTPPLFVAQPGQTFQSMDGSPSDLYVVGAKANGDPQIPTLVTLSSSTPQAPESWSFLLDPTAGVAVATDGVTAVATTPSAAWFGPPLGPESRWSRVDAGPAAAGGGFGTSAAVSGRFAMVGAPQQSLLQGPLAGSVYVFHQGSGLGTTCSDPAQCRSEFCVDSVCCDQACDEGAHGGGCLRCAHDTGLCGPAPASVTCRAGAPCASATTCDGVSTTCPARLLLPNDTPCEDVVFGTCKNGACIPPPDAGPSALDAGLDDAPAPSMPPAGCACDVPHGQGGMAATLLLVVLTLGRLLARRRPRGGP